MSERIQLNARSLFLVLLLTLAAVTTTVTRSDAGTSVDTPKCQFTQGPVTSVSAKTGGQQLTFSYSCTGRGDVITEVDVTQGTTTYVASLSQKLSTGSYSESQELHLPAIPRIDPICVTVNGTKVCVPPSVPPAA